MDDDHSFECVENDHLAEFVSERLPTSNNVVQGQKDTFAVGKKIAHGKYGAVYEVLRRRDGKVFTAKLEVCGINTRALSMDCVVLKAANRANMNHFCTLVDRGMIQNHFKFLVMNRLGDNLYKLRLQFQQSRFSAPTALRTALEMLTALEQLHSLGFVHRDVKPSNFALLEEKKGQSKIILLDFGLCRHYKNQNGEVKAPRQNTQFRGTLRYASLAAHRDQEQYPKDDLESWLYVIIEFMAGELPWGNFHNISTEKDIVKKAKEWSRNHEGTMQLLKFCPKMEFRHIMKYLDGLQFTKTPDYQYLRSLLHLAMRNNDIKPDEPYDWEQEEEEEEMNGDAHKDANKMTNSTLLNGK